MSKDRGDTQTPATTGSLSPLWRPRFTTRYEYLAAHKDVPYAMAYLELLTQNLKIEDLRKSAAGLEQSARMDIERWQTELEALPTFDESHFDDLIHSYPPYLRKVMDERTKDVIWYEEHLRYDPAVNGK